MTKYKISHHEKLIYMQLQGEFTAREFVKFLMLVSMDADYDRSFNSIVDLQEFKNVLSMKEAQDVIESATAIRGGTSAKSAIVTGSLFRKNLVDLANTFNGRKKIEVKGFTSLSDACRWLDVDENALS